MPPKITFQTQYDHYEFLVMSLGMNNTHATFMQLMNGVFWPCLDPFVIVFIDDILVYSRTEEDHVRHLRIVLQRLRKKKLYGKFLKSELLLDYMAFLGHVVSKEGSQVNLVKIETVRGWTRLTSPTLLQSFVGLEGYYRRFVEFLHYCSPGCGFFNGPMGVRRAFKISTPCRLQLMC
ncbi:hypothetical protein MTR67_052696 [Solanum verrucosum]|uniref:Reverse transcriptase domain-containing protein n=1 Tax=Solanum verrucosum TaxID=315347 RepID=A0AAF1A1A4_SOLVR|nr:hypothetical protein MTR67_052696 [Solanum verrucosum]